MKGDRRNSPSSEGNFRILNVQTFSDENCSDVNLCV